MPVESTTALRKSPGRRLRTLAVAGVLAAASAAAGSPVSAQSEVHRTALHDFRVVTVADGFVIPWSMAFLPGGDLLVTERPGRLRIVRDGELLPAPVPGVPAVRAEGQGGLLDVVLHPDFANNRLVYLSYSKPSEDGTQSTTAVGRGRFVNDRLEEFQEIFVARKWEDGRRGHYGSKLAFDAKGYLHITLGDRMAVPAGDLEAHPAQDVASHHGTTIRLHDDGRVPSNNPFVGKEGALPEIWTYGHRNGQGIAIHPGTGDVWYHEHGPQGGDELNVLEPGKNYGWPVVGYGVNYRSGSAIHAATRRQGMEDPVHVWVPSIGISGMMIYDGDKFPGWRGNIFVGGLSGQQVGRLTLDGRRVLNVETFLQRIGRIRDVRQGPDGFIYVAIEDRQGAPTPIVRLEPAGR